MAKKRIPSQGKTKPEQWENVMFEPRSVGQGKTRVPESYGFLQTLETVGKHGFRSAELAAREGDTKKVPAHAEEQRWGPIQSVVIS